MCVGVLLRIIPTSEGIAVSRHWLDFGGIRFLTMIHELGRIIGTALTVLIKYQPVTDRRVDLKDNIALYTNLSFVFINCTGLYSRNDVSLSLHDAPALKGVYVVLGTIRHIDGAFH